VSEEETERSMLDFFLTDQIARGNVEVEYCCTDEMIGYFMTKPFQGSKFRSFRKAILGED